MAAEGVINKYSPSGLLIVVIKRYFPYSSRNEYVPAIFPFLLKGAVTRICSPDMMKNMI